MEQEGQAEITLRDELSAQVYAAEAPQETAEQREERIRDEKGRFAKAESTDAPKVSPVVRGGEDGANARTPATTLPPGNVGGAPTNTALERPARPSSWKKDYWEHWDKLDPKLAEYINQRESEYARGVSTYKAEAENARQLNEALAPFQPLLQQHNIQPGQWITNLGNAHKQLALGSPQEKLIMFQKLASDYGVPLQALLGGQQPDPYVNQLYQQVTQISSELNNFKSQQERQQQQAIQNEIQQFASTHPHYEAVRETMAGLLQSNVFPDLEGEKALESAYEKAIRLHDDIWSQVQQEKQQAELTKKVEQTRNTAQRARNAAVSPKSATTGVQPTPKSDKSSGNVRSDVEEAWDAHAESRV